MKKSPCQEFQEAIMKVLKKHNSCMRGQKIKDALKKKKEKNANKRN